MDNESRPNHQTGDGFYLPETKQDADSVFISLAQAARMTGYHQDYLGQVARSGKLEAKKIGRNWVTTRKAINHFLGRDRETEKTVPTFVAKMPEPKIYQPIVVKTSEPQIVAAPLPVEEKIETVIEPVQVVQPVEEVVIQTVIEETVEIKNEPVPKAAVTEKRKSIYEILEINSAAGLNVQEALIESVSAINFQKLSFEKRSAITKFATAPRKKFATSKAVTQRPTQTLGPIPKRKVKKIFGPVQDVVLKPAPKTFTFARVMAATLFLIAIAGGSFSIVYFKKDNTTAPEILTASQTQEEIDKKIAGTTTSALGQGKVIKGETLLKVYNENVLPDSEVLIVFKSYNPGRYWIINQLAGQFTVKLSEPAYADIEFDYWVSDTDSVDSSVEPDTEESAPPPPEETTNPKKLKEVREQGVLMSPGYTEIE